MWTRCRDHLPGAHFEADGVAHRRCVSAAGFRSSREFCRRPHAPGREGSRRGGPAQYRAQHGAPRLRGISATGAQCLCASNQK